MELQNSFGLERYIKVEYNSKENPNKVYPITELLKDYTEEDKIFNSKGIETIANYISNFNKNYYDRTLTIENILNKLKKYCVIKVQIDMSIKDIYAWKSDPLYEEYSKYKDQIETDNFPLPVFIAPCGLTDCRKMFSVDGMHRIMSALEFGMTNIESYILVERDRLVYELNSKDIHNIDKEARKCTWFPRYQEIKEVNLEGQRKQVPRYTEIYDFSFLENKTVVDLGCNTGQAIFEAYFAGAKACYGFDYQLEAISTAKMITNTFNINDSVTFDTIDFNNWDTMDKVSEIGSCDWVIFQAIYRTKEIEDIEKVMNFVYNFVTEGIIFEGNAAPEIDTFEFYNEKVFKKYNLKYKFLGHSENRPVWILKK
jgi:SAM-dependent methyltransferase